MLMRSQAAAQAIKGIIKRGGVTVSLLAVAFAGPAAAVSWPERPVTIIVPFSAGGATDIVARQLSYALSKKWGQSVVVENKTGAGGNIGTGLVASAKPDGYTLLMASGANLTVNPHLYDNLAFNVETDFAPITNVAVGPMVMAVSESVKSADLAEFIQSAKADPGKYTIGSAGVGSQGHLAGENFQYAADIELSHIPYRGESAAFSDLMAGQIDAVVGNIGAAFSPLSSGRIRILAVASDEPTDMLPNTPTAKQFGVDGFVNYGWFGLLAPAGTDAAIVDKVHAHVKEILADEESSKKLAELGMWGLANTPAQFKEQITSESGQWKQVIQERNITIDN